MRYGYRRVHVHLCRNGWKINMKKTRRIYSELGLQLRNKHPKRRVKAKLRDDRQEAVGPNDVWAMPCLGRRLLANAERGTSFTTSSQPARSCVS